MSTLYPSSIGMENLLRFLHKYSRIERQPFAFGGHTLHPVEVHTLAFIAKEKKTFVSKIARETGVTRGAVSQVVGKLEKKKLVTRIKDEKNASRVFLIPTKAGKNVAEAHVEFHKQRDERFLSFLESLSADQKRLIKELFFEMDCWMDNYLEEP